MDLELPDDILYLICDQVRRLPDSAGTLFNCAISGKRLAPLALANLYRHARSPGNYEELDYGGDMDSVVMKWAVMWRSIHSACKGKTLFPYASYLRFADLRDLINLVEHNRFQRPKIESYFYSDDLIKFKIRNNPTPLVEHIGDAIFSQNTLMEVVSGHFSSDALQRWISRLPRLRRLELWEGDVLGDAKTQDTICTSCPDFKELSIYRWTGSKADAHLGPFFERLPAQTLVELRTIAMCGVSTRTALALNRHCDALTDLHLILEPDALGALGEMRSCTYLERLHLELTRNANLQAQQAETFNEFTVWLGECKRLRELTLTNIESAQTALVPMLLDEGVQLEELTIDALYAPFFTDDTSFDYALTHQKSLFSLDLRGDGEWATPEQITHFIESVTQLVKLKKLELRGLMENFEEGHTIQMLLGLSQIQELFTGGQVITDATLDAVAGEMTNLKRWTIMTPSRFTTDALLRFIDNLEQHGNANLQISVDMADPDHLLTSEEQVLVATTLKTKVGGTFDYMAWRDPGLSDSEDYSD